MKTISIGNAGGFWGDDLDALRRQLAGGRLDYVTSDFLAEITMGILMKQKLADPEAGYVPDFVAQLDAVLPLLAERGTRIITNAGGVNPQALGRRLIETARRRGIDLTVAVVDGDDLTPRLDELYPAAAPFDNLEDGRPFEAVRGRILSANAYLGCPAIVRALESGAQVIVTGRATDTAITLAPMVHAFGWPLDDWDRLAAGVVAGHIIECGAQSTGGNFTDWPTVRKWGDMGFPVLEVSADGAFTVTKHSGTGGRVSVHTVTEQLLYEMGSPVEYISPDVIADFTTIRLADDGPDRVRVTGVRGRPATPYLKVSMSYAAGYKASGALLIGGGDLGRKAAVLRDAFWQRLGLSFRKTFTEVVGGGAWPGGAPCTQALVHFSVLDDNPAHVEAFGKLLSTMILSGPAGMAVTGGRPKPQRVLAYWPSLIRKELVGARLTVLDTRGDRDGAVDIPARTGLEAEYRPVADPTLRLSDQPGAVDESAATVPIVLVPLRELCLARSGDKGDTANIGVIARNRIVWDVLREHLSPDWVREVFRGVCHGRVARHEVENLLAFNFLLQETLDGGGANSLRLDAQGKLLGQALLDQSLPLPRLDAERIRASLR
jgi:hypothetical protein